MSKEFYRKGKWPINTNHAWKIRAATKATEDLFAACPDEVSHSVILGQPFITASRMETKVLDSGGAFTRIRSQNGVHGSGVCMAECIRAYARLSAQVGRTARRFVTRGSVGVLLGGS